MVFDYYRKALVYDITNTDFKNDGWSSGDK